MKFLFVGSICIEPDARKRRNNIFNFNIPNTIKIREISNPNTIINQRCQISNIRTASGKQTIIPQPIKILAKYTYKLR